MSRFIPGYSECRARRWLNPSLGPWPGKLVGVNTSKGCFSSTAPELLFAGSRSMEIMVSVKGVPSVPTTVFKDNTSDGPGMGLYLNTEGNFYVSLAGNMISVMDAFLWLRLYQCFVE